uniref:Uncharacterized protein n=1 Tax=Anguilla anguilla TaxID=7936 RepID=A0A0E9WUY6_ANGAN
MVMFDDENRPSWLIFACCLECDQRCFEPGFVHARVFRFTPHPLNLFQIFSPVKNNLYCLCDLAFDFFPTCAPKPKR